MSNSDNDLCTFCNLELVYEILKFVRSNCEKSEGRIAATTTYDEAVHLFNTNIDNLKYHCSLLHREGCFDCTFDEFVLTIKFSNIALKAEILFQQIRGFIGK